MSYILDALRRAEAERERGAVPGLQSQQQQIEIEDDAPARSRLLVWAVIGLAFALIATLAWTLLGGGTPPRQIAEGPVTAAPAAALVATTAAVPQSLAEIAAAPPPATVAPQTAPPPPAIVQPVQMQPPTQPAPRPVAIAPAKVAPQVALATPRVEAPKPAPAVALAAPKVEAAKQPPATAASEPRIYAQSELPADIQRELPRVAINGSSYSGDAASRMVMINGQVFHEGDQLSAGLVLDKIRRRSAVLAYKGFRYEVMF